MGTEHYIVDLRAKRVLDIHKSYWIGPLVGQTASTAQILAVFDAGDPGRYCHQPRVWAAVATWLEQWATGPVVVLSDSQDDPLPFTDDRGYLRDDWSGWTAFSWWNMERTRWAWWGDTLAPPTIG